MSPRSAPMRAAKGPHPPSQGPHVVRADDESLVALVRQGDDEAFRSLYQRHVHRVHARLTRLLGPASEIEDLVQRVFWSFFLALPRYRGDASVSAFLHGILTRVAYDALRKRKRTPSRPFREAELEQLLSPQQDPETRARAREGVAALYSALDQLKPTQRVAFVLHAIEELSLVEIAALTDAQPRTVGQRVAAARRKLKRSLQLRQRMKPGAGP